MARNRGTTPEVLLRVPFPELLNSTVIVLPVDVMDGLRRKPLRLTALVASIAFPSFT